MKNKIIVYKSLNYNGELNHNWYYIYIDKNDLNLQDEIIQWFRNNNVADQTDNWIHTGQISWIELVVNMSRERKLEFDMIFK